MKSFFALSRLSHTNLSSLNGCFVVYHLFSEAFRSTLGFGGASDRRLTEHLDLHEDHRTV